MTFGSGQVHERLKQASGRLALARHEMAKLARLAEYPDDLDSELPAYSRAAFLRKAEEAAALGVLSCLVMIDLSGGARLSRNHPNGLRKKSDPQASATSTGLTETLSTPPDSSFPGNRESRAHTGKLERLRERALDPRLRGDDAENGSLTPASNGGHDMALACQLINRDTRASDILGRTREEQFALLLFDALEAGGWSAARRLAALIASTAPAGAGDVRVSVMETGMAAREPCLLEALEQRLRAIS